MWVPSRDFLNDHIKSAHPGERPYECTFCDKAYRSSAQMNIHREEDINGDTKVISVSFLTSSKFLPLHGKGPLSNLQNCPSYKPPISALEIMEKAHDVYSFLRF